MKTIRLLGALGKRFGTTHRFDVATPAEAIRALVANYEGFKQFLVDSQELGLVYKIFVGHRRVGSEEEVHMGTAEESICFAPVIAGSKSAWGQIFVGALLVATSMGFGPLGGLFVGEFAVFAGAAATVGAIGISMALGGVAQLLAPSPKSKGPSEGTKNNPSYLFNGPVNTTAQGQPIALGYGRMIVGSAVISAGIYSEDIR